MWPLKVALIVLGLACIAVGPLALVKSLPLLKSGKVREMKAGATPLACGAAMFVMGFALFYFPFTF